MEYFKETNKLLFEPTFLEFAHRTYESFIKLDEGEYWKAMDFGQTFDLSIQGWLFKCGKNEPVRFFSGFAAPFKVYAIKEAKELLHQDWKDFESTLSEVSAKGISNAITEFLQEASKVQIKIAQISYLLPLQVGLYEVLDRIDNHYKQDLSNSINPNSMSDKVQATKLKWRGGASALCALFLDLRAEQMKKTDVKYLSIGNVQLVQFIMDNFEFLNSDNEVETISRDSVKRYVDGKDISQKIKLDFSGLKK